MSPSPTHGSTVTWKPLVICPNGDMLRRAGAMLGELTAGAAVMVTEYPRPGSAAALAAQHGCNICFLDAATNFEQAQKLIAELAPGMPVVALHVRNDAETILRCLRCGACEYLAELAPVTVRGVLERLERARGGAAAPAAGAVYCVVPGKPGCGASTLAVHLAIGMRASGVSPVLLVDADSFAGSIAFQLKLKAEFHLGDVLRDWKRMDDDVWARLTVPAGGVDVLAAPENAAARIDLTRLQAAELCAFWSARYRAVVLDVPDLRFAADGGFTALADVLLLVATGDLTALQATRRGLQYLDQAGGDRTRIRLVLSRHLAEAGLARADVKAVLGLDPFALLPNEFELLQTALLEGKTAPAGSRFAGAVRTLCRQLANRDAPVKEKKKGAWYTGIFSHK
jgi:pilus assembly protein CpaE